MKSKTFIYRAIGILSLLGTAAFAGIRRSSIPLSPILNGRNSQVQELGVPVITQSTTTSCGEAAITMAYQYAYPRDAISERAVIEYAESQGLYMPGLAPFTSPADMVGLAQHYTGAVETSNVSSEQEGLSLLTDRFNLGEPVIIDVTAVLSDPQSGAHFVVVTGVAIDAFSGNATIAYNNPLTGEVEHADWAGGEGIWQAWRNNGDPGGSGWWLVIPPA
jgi:hypothetical protein